MKSIEDLLRDRKASAQEALEVFDSLPVATLEFMIGRWKGFEIQTNHRMDGLLVPSGWYGKLFIDTEQVHPLLFYSLNKTALYAVNPRLIPLHINFPRWNALGTVIVLLRPVLQTRKTCARLRMVEYRNRLTATMCYDEKAIFDHFVVIDEGRVMGVMDLKGVTEPYIFILERDGDSDLKQDF
jgi:hypothetical protein